MIELKDLGKIRTLKKKFLDQVSISTLSITVPENVEILGWYNDPKHSLKMFVFRDSKGILWKRLTRDNVDYGQQIFID